MILITHVGYKPFVIICTLNIRPKQIRWIHSIVIFAYEELAIVYPVCIQNGINGHVRMIQQEIIGKNEAIGRMPWYSGYGRRLMF